MRGHLLTAATLAAAAAGAAALAQGEPPKPNVSAMSIKEIRVHNAGLTAKHPQFIVCKRQSVTGSLARKTRTCLTNESWEKRAEAARDFTAKVMDDSMNECEPGQAC
ncbi:MAG: hypothetical protein ACEQR8_08995 [Cypionkella sp.]